MYRNKLPFILASGSPRRQEFLKKLGLNFNIQTADINESKTHDESAIELVKRLAREKGIVVAKENPDTWTISADTIVCLEEQILGKPKNEEDALFMLMSLSGKTHLVYTAFALTHVNKGICDIKSVTTEVSFTPFTEKTARAYIATKEPMDKAGSYGIQGTGGVLVEKINGSYSNVVGLPLAQLIGKMEKYEII